MSTQRCLAIESEPNIALLTGDGLMCLAMAMLQEMPAAQAFEPQRLLRRAPEVRVAVASVPRPPSNGLEVVQSAIH